MGREPEVKMVGAIADWARRTTSSFTELRADPSVPTADAGNSPAARNDRIYRLRHWPQLPRAVHTVEVLRLLSVMSARPVRRSWVLAQPGWSPSRLDQLVARLDAQDVLESIDPASLPRERPPG